MVGLTPLPLANVFFWFWIFLIWKLFFGKIGNNSATSRENVMNKKIAKKL